MGASSDEDRAATPSGPSPEEVSGIAGIPCATEMLERVAIAIDAEAWAAMSDGRDVPGTFWHVRRDIARNRAIAVMSELREPPYEVVRAVAMRAWRSGSGINPKTVWQAGIDAILRAQ